MPARVEREREKRKKLERHSFYYREGGEKWEANWCSTRPKSDELYRVLTNRLYTWLARRARDSRASDNTKRYTQKKRYLTYYFQRGCVYVDTFVSNKKKTLFFVKDSRFHSFEKFKIRYASFSYFLNTLHRVGGEVERSAHEETSAQFRRKLYYL